MKPSGKYLPGRSLVVGGAGFLGSNLCRLILKTQPNTKVLCIDNFYTGHRENIEELFSDERFQFMEHDITNPLNIDEQADEIYNLACPASPPHYQKDPIYTTKVSVLGILNLLDMAKKHNAKILQASTSEVYGEPQVHPQTENYRGNVSCTGIRSCYDEGKRCAESLLFDYRRMYGVKVKVVRIFNTYGENMDVNDGRVVSNFIVQCLQNKDMTVYGDGSQTRSLCYVSDLLEGMLSVMASDDDFTGPVNLGNPEEYSVKEIAEKIKHIIGGSSAIVYRPLPKDDPTHRRPDISLACRKLGWKPKVSVDDGLRRTIDYFRKKIA